MTPQDAWLKWTAEMPVDLPPSKEDIEMMMGRYVPSRTVNKNGLRLHGLPFNSNPIGALRNDHADLDGVMRDVELKYRSDDISTAWALHPDPERAGKTLAVPAYCKHMHYARGLSEYRHTVIAAHARETASEGVVTVHQLMEAKQRLARIAEDMFADRVANGGTARVNEVLKAHRTYLLEPTELPEDTPGTNAPLEVLEPEPFVDGAEPDPGDGRPPLRREVAVSGTLGEQEVRARVRRRLGRLDNV
jgi:hypothetical protein